MSGIANAAPSAKLMSAWDAAALIESGMILGLSGFTGSGYPKAVPLTHAEQIEAAHRAGKLFRVRIWI